MKGRGRVRGILIEGSDRREYLLGFGADQSPIFSRRRADGTAGHSNFLSLRGRVG